MKNIFFEWKQQIIDCACDNQFKDAIVEFFE